jgi:LDH2 family malate/lactate/ureidoglycolate dehydrogenase
MSSPPDTDAVILPAAVLERAATRVLEALGVPAEDAALTAEVFVGAEVSGEPSHGLRLLVTVCERIEAGGHRAETRIDVDRDMGAIAVWTAHRSLGQAVAVRAMDAAIGKARDFGVGIVAVRDATSLTSAKHYALRAAAAGCVGLVQTNASRKVMPPPGGTTPVMGNNPIAMAAPAGRFGAICLDMAMTAVAIERINMAREAGTPIPPDWALGRDGRPTTDPEIAAEVMTLLPFGGYKAFGLGLMTELMTSVLAGGEVFAGEATGFRPLDNPMRTSFTLTALNIEAFTARGEFDRRVETMIERLKSSKPEVEGGEILFPGERSQRLAVARRRDGVPVAQGTLGTFSALCRKLGVTPPEG